eukprot:7386177-Prymnesium_polylepis.1
MKRTEPEHRHEVALREKRMKGVNTAGLYWLGFSIQGRADHRVCCERSSCAPCDDIRGDYRASRPTAARAAVSVRHLGSLHAREHRRSANPACVTRRKV